MINNIQFTESGHFSQIYMIFRLQVGNHGLTYKKRTNAVVRSSSKDQEACLLFLKLERTKR